MQSPKDLVLQVGFKCFFCAAEGEDRQQENSFSLLKNKEMFFGKRLCPCFSKPLSYYCKKFCFAR
jgi:hypothetical protein